jgi:spermidine/putrescine transport system permease protein
MALPLYVALEQIDPRLIEAARTCTRARPGVPARHAAALDAGRVAGTLLTFIPPPATSSTRSCSGRRSQYMIGNVIQSKFLELTDYPAAAALSLL